MKKSILTIKNLHKEFVIGGKKLKILIDVNIDIKEGESLSIIGPSGSGKSTLMGLLAGLERPSKGQILFHGEAIQNLSEDDLSIWRRKSVGFIFQNFRLIESLTALENVRLPLEINGENTQDASNKAFSLLKEVGLANRQNHFPQQLSGGEQQRIAIARAYIHQPAIIFADEPTGSLDPKTADAVFEKLLKINRDKKTTLILVTHNLELAKRLDRHIELISKN